MKSLFWSLFCAVSLTFSPAALAQTSPQDSRLSKIHSKIVTDHPALTHVSGAEITALINNDQNILLLDVREAKEFSVSHIDGAVRVDPDISLKDFMARFGDKAIGKQVILYCSVGRRSSRLGDNVREALLTAGATRVSNLEGGVFRWHNAHGPLVSGDIETDKVHPYNIWWGRLLERKGAIAYTPDARQDR